MDDDDGPSILVHTALVQQGSPRIPADMPANVLRGVDTCETSLRMLLQCVKQFESELFCQHHIAVFDACRKKRVSGCCDCWQCAVDLAVLRPLCVNDNLWHVRMQTFGNAY